MVKVTPKTILILYIRPQIYWLLTGNTERKTCVPGFIPPTSLLQD